MTDDGPSAADSEATPAAGSPSDAASESPQWAKYGLALLVVAVFVAGVARVVHPTGAALAFMTVLSLFGVGVFLLAVRERLAE